MAIIVSALVFTIVDILGTPRTESWLTLEFGEEYIDGGISFDLAPYYKIVDYIHVGQISGEWVRSVIEPRPGVLIASGSKVFMQPNPEDYSRPTSVRFEVLALNILSGGGIATITSAPVAAISGVRFIAHIIGY